MHYTGRLCKGGNGRFWAFPPDGLEAGRKGGSRRNLYNPGAFHNIRLMKLTPNQGTPGVRIDDIDLSKPISEAQFATILAALGNTACSASRNRRSMRGP